MSLRLACPCLLALLLAGCNAGGTSDLEQFIKTTGQDGAGQIDPLPVVKQVDTFEYRQDDLTDPFLPRNLRPAGKGIQPDLARPKQPLEEFPLDALRLVGTLKHPGQSTKAVIRDPKGTLYTIQVGARIGQNYGKVVAIQDHALDIRELMQDGSGEWIESKAVMSMAD